MDLSVYNGKPVRLTDRNGAVHTGTAVVPALSGEDISSGADPVLGIGSELFTADQISSLDYLPSFQEAEEAIPPGRYRHFKGREYEVLAVARHSETMEPLVVYRALYGDFGIWVRPASMWSETVTRNGASFPRFERTDG